MSVGAGRKKKGEDFSVKFDNFVTKLDSWIASRKPQEIKLIALLIPVLLLIGDYQYIIPKVSKQAEKSKAAYDETMRKIRAFKDGGGKEEVQRLEAETARLRDSIIRMNQTDSYIQVQLTGIDHLFFSTLEWAQHLDFVTEKAAENHIVITTQENKVQGSQVGFGPVMEVVVDGEGSFQSAMKYLFIVETGVSITPIEELEMKIDEKDRLAFKAKSVLWGMK